MAVPKPPPIAGILAMLLLGIGVPFLFDARAMPSECSPTLARERLEKLLAGPARIDYSKGLYSPRPGFFWSAIERAARYEVTLSKGGRTLVAGAAASDPWYLVRDPARFEPGSDYKLTVRGIDASGARVGAARETNFSLLPSEPRDTTMQKSAPLSWEEREWVLAGLYAELGSPADAAASLRNFLDARPTGAEADLARRVLDHLGVATRKAG